MAQDIPTQVMAMDQTGGINTNRWTTMEIWADEHLFHTQAKLGVLFQVTHGVLSEFTPHF